MRRADVFSGDPSPPAAFDRAANEVGRIPLTFPNRFDGVLTSVLSPLCFHQIPFSGDLFVHLCRRGRGVRLAPPPLLLYAHHLKA